MKTIKTITLDDAKKAIQAMENKAIENGTDLAFCILDCMGNILILEKMDNAKPAAVGVARAKAVTSLRFCLKTSDLSKIMKEEDLDIEYLAGDCDTAITGGIPLYENINSDVPSGAIGISGGASEKDEEIALIGMEILGLKLKE